VRLFERLVELGFMAVTLGFLLQDGLSWRALHRATVQDSVPTDLLWLRMSQYKPWFVKAPFNELIVGTFAIALSGAILMLAYAAWAEERPHSPDRSAQ